MSKISSWLWPLETVTEPPFPLSLHLKHRFWSDRGARRHMFDLHSCRFLKRNTLPPSLLLIIPLFKLCCPQHNSLFALQVFFSPSSFNSLRFIFPPCRPSFITPYLTWNCKQFPSWKRQQWWKLRWRGWMPEARAFVSVVLLISSQWRAAFDTRHRSSTIFQALHLFSV